MLDISRSLSREECQCVAKVGKVGFSHKAVTTDCLARALPAIRRLADQKSAVRNFAGSRIIKPSMRSASAQKPVSSACSCAGELRADFESP